VVRLYLGVFEDDEYKNFLPLTYTRPVYELKTGFFTLLERYKWFLQPEKIFLFTRDYLTNVLRRKLKHPGCHVNEVDSIDNDILMVNGRLLDLKLLTPILKGETDALLTENEVLAVKVKAEKVEEAVPKLARTTSSASQVTVVKRLFKRVITVKDHDATVHYPWELVNLNFAYIKHDYEVVVKKKSHDVPDGVILRGNPEMVYIAQTAEIEPTVIIDARKGPVYIDEQVKVFAPARIEGPCFIGEKTEVFNAQIRPGCHVGPDCRVGGELTSSIIHGFSNKRHESFMGRAYIGEWVNIGALTSNSDLKNTYGTVKVVVSGVKVDTGLRKVGCFIGDHAKTAIGTFIYTGKKIGVHSHVHGYVIEDVPSFTLYMRFAGRQPVELYLDSVIKIQKRVFERRGVKQTREDVELIKYLFKITEEERRRAGVTGKP